MKTNVLTDLGKAPYSIIDYSEGQAYCEHCGRGIQYIYTIKSADGKVFNLGMSCVGYTADRELKRDAREVREYRKSNLSFAQWQEVKAARLARAEAQKQQALEWANQREATEKALVARRKAAFKKFRPSFDTMPHPNEYFASQGKTMTDYLNYFHGDIDSLMDNPAWNWAWTTKLSVILEELDK